MGQADEKSGCLKYANSLQLEAELVELLHQNLRDLCYLACIWIVAPKTLIVLILRHPCPVKSL